MCKKFLAPSLFIVLFLFFSLSIFSYNFNDISYPHPEVIKNLVGLAGAYISYFFFSIFGYVAYFVPFLCLFLFLFSLKKKGLVGGFLILFLLVVIVDIFFYGLWNASGEHLIRIGYYKCGIVGSFLGRHFFLYLGKTGGFAVTYLLFFFFIFLLGLRILSIFPKSNKPERKKLLPKEQVKIYKPEKKIKIDYRVGERKVGEWIFPPLDFLRSLTTKSVFASNDEIYRRSQALEEKLLNFGVEGRVTGVLPGPVVTMYEFEPAAGVRVNRIVNLSNDLAMAMKALSVRILAPVPGKAVVGIEISNKNRETVYMKEVIGSKSFRDSTSRLTLALGKDTLGRPFIADLVKMPHLLIAGATGSGKSVGINAMIVSILYKALPEDVKFVMIDPKMLELTAYDSIPYLFMPIITDPKEATIALSLLVGEMEGRYKTMSQAGVKNIEKYNSKAEAGECEKLPYIVVVIDELADLMMVSSRKVESSIVRLAQMARASGMHLICATQRPSVDVITGLIKANFPARISFKVSSKADSRVILDTSGAESLLGCGDMLFLPPGTSELKRIHGAFLSEEEIGRVVSFVKEEEEPQYDSRLISGIEEAKEMKDENREYDEYYGEALDIIKQGGNPSISYIQRRLKVGYNRAARIVEQMERDGVLSPPDEKGRREALL
jgi:S-DNA-T family DNA segregation ATPase FtsK/SpoIIIE